ncbi:MAG: leucine-rich repeat domain-containing protein, partial [Clostridia bacterium]|nr:leucine-rich repeat domain-containing protein [Clostridia bacterium]
QAAFRETPSLITVELPDNLKKIEQAMFRGSGIKSITIPNGVEELDEAVFCGCAELETVVISDSVKKMTDGGFRGCGKLKKLIIPRNIQGLDRNSFSDSPMVDVIIGNLHYHNSIVSEADV